AAEPADPRGGVAGADRPDQVGAVQVAARLARAEEQVHGIRACEWVVSAGYCDLRRSCVTGMSLPRRSVVAGSSGAGVAGGVAPAGSFLPGSAVGSATRR